MILVLPIAYSYSSLLLMFFLTSSLYLTLLLHFSILSSLSLHPFYPISPSHLSIHPLYASPLSLLPIPPLHPSSLSLLYVFLSILSVLSLLSIAPLCPSPSGQRWQLLQPRSDPYWHPGIWGNSENWPVFLVRTVNEVKEILLVDQKNKYLENSAILLQDYISIIKGSILVSIFVVCVLLGSNGHQRSCDVI